MNKQILQGGFAAFMAVWLALLPLTSLLAAPVIQGYTFGECSRIDQGAIQQELAALVGEILLGGADGPDFDALVARAWKTGGADGVLDQAVDAAVVRVAQEEDYFQRLWSGWSSDKAAELASKVAAYAFADPAVTAKLDELATLLAQTLVAEMQANVARSASSALLCLQDYVGERYSTTLFAAFQAELSRDLAADTLSDVAPSVDVSPVTLHSRGLTGVGVIVATQITRRLAQSLTQKMVGRLAGKIAGRVLGRLGTSVIPYIGWVVGAGLLAWDLWGGAQGALPQISEALKAEEVKEEIRAEIAAAMREGITGEVDTVASTLAASLVGQWQGFCLANRDLCTLAGENVSFRTVLNATPVTQLSALRRWIDLLVQAGGKEAPAQAAADGSLEMLLALPEAAQLILTWSGSVTQTLAWAGLAGESLPQVLDYQLYRRIDPTALTSLSLAAIVAIGDNGQIHKLWALEPTGLMVLLALPPADLPTIVAGASESELVWLAGYLAELPADEIAAVSAALAQGTLSVVQLQVSSAATITATIPATVAQIGPASGTVVPIAPADPGASGRQWADNGILMAALLLVGLVIGVGFGLSLRREVRQIADQAADAGGEPPRRDAATAPPANTAEPGST